VNSLELEKLVHDIVQEVLRRIENDPRLAAAIRGSRQQIQKSKYTATCSQQAAMLHAQKKLYNERDILTLAKQGVTEIKLEKKTIITPAARDAARAKGIRLVRES